MNAWRRLLLAMVCGVAVASIYAAQPVLEAMGRDLGVPAELTGWIVATGQFGYLAGLALLVPLGDVVDRRRLIAGHLAVTAVGMILTASASVAWVAFAGLAAAGVFAVVVQTTVAYAAAVSPPGERGRNIGVVTSGVVVGILGARVVTGTLAQAWGWRSVYAVLAVLSLGLAALVLVALPSEERPGPPVGYRRVVVALGGLFGQRVFLTRGLIASTHSAPPSAQPRPPPSSPPTAGRAPVSSGRGSRPARWPSGRPRGDAPATARTSRVNPAQGLDRDAAGPRGGPSGERGQDPRIGLGLPLRRAPNVGACAFESSTPSPIAPSPATRPGSFF
jgi:MFS family permease